MTPFDTAAWKVKSVTAVGILLEIEDLIWSSLGLFGLTRNEICRLLLRAKSSRESSGRADVKFHSSSAEEPFCAETAGTADRNEAVLPWGGG